MTAREKILWLVTNSCLGDTVSFLNSSHPNYRQLIEEFFELCYNNFLSSAEGERAAEILSALAAGPSDAFTLVVEGTVPSAAEGLYCVLGYRRGRPWTALEAVRELAGKARYVVAAGTCAAFGGPYAAHPNPTGSLPVSKVVRRRVINVPGCPVHPDWLAGTLYHLARYGEPRLDEYNRPVLYFGETVHDRCERRHYFESGIFAREPGEPWCMYKIGCKGPVTHADCPVRQWSGEHTSWPVGANTPCIGCTSPEFPDGVAPFFEHLPDIGTPAVKVTANRVGLLTGAATALGIGAHLAANILSGRLAYTIRRGLGAAKKPASLLQKSHRRKVKQRDGKCAGP
ncbi:MAG: hydrogenase small subunit [Bacillota bacterium]